MKNSQIEKTRDGYIVHRESKIEDKKTITCQEIRGSLIMLDALTKRPGYYLLIGRKREENNKKLPSLIFLKEIIEHSREVLIEKLKNDESKFRYHIIYTEEPLKPKRGEPLDGFFKYLRETFKNVSWVRLWPALHRDDISQGINLFTQWRNAGALEIPRDTILQGQVGAIQPGVIPDESSFAFHALRHILSGFEHQEISVERIERERADTFKKNTRKKLTGAARVAADEFMRICGEIERQSEFENDILW